MHHNWLKVAIGSKLLGGFGCVVRYGDHSTSALQHSRQALAVLFALEVLFKGIAAAQANLAAHAVICQVGMRVLIA